MLLFLITLDDLFQLSQSSCSKNLSEGVPTLVQLVNDPTRNHGVASSTPGLAQWVKDPALP